MRRLALRPQTDAIARRFPTGLDLGSTALKWAQLGLVDGQPTLIGLGYQPRQAGPTLSEADRQAQLRELLQRLVKQRQAERPQVAAPAHGG